jgi:hypothetical protein
MEEELKRLYRLGDYDETIKEILEVHLKMVKTIIEALFENPRGTLKERTAGLLEEKQVYSFHARRSKPSNKDLNDAVVIHDKVQLVGETDEDFQQRIRVNTYHSSITSIITMIERMKCSNAGKPSALEHLSTGDNYKKITDRIRALIDSHNQKNGTSIVAEKEMLRLIYSFYYSINMVPHTFPIYRSILVFMLRLAPLIEDVKTSELSVQTLISAIRVSDTSSGWGDRFYHSVLLNHVLAKKLAQYGYPQSHIDDFKENVYTGLDVNQDTEFIYQRIREVLSASEVGDVSVKLLVMDSTSRAAHVQLKGGSMILTSSPTLLENYSKAEGDSGRYSSGSDPVSDAKSWVNNYLSAVLGIFLLMDLNYKNKVKEVARSGKTTKLIPPAYFDYIDKYIVPFNGKKVLVNLDVMVENKLAKHMNKDYKFRKLYICYGDSGEKIRGCKECGDGICDTCNRTYVLRTLYILEHV